MLKDIYIIKNDINSKVYVGQSNNSEQRFKEHCWSNKDNSLIDKAIKKYGVEHFWYEILEAQISDYNEKEKFYINFYNSISPNGYNILPGGEEPPIRRGFDNCQSKFTQKDIDEILYLLTLKIPIIDIADHYNVKYLAIKNINDGITYRQEGLQYPIRNFRLSGEFKNQVPLDKVKEIVKYIKEHPEFSLRKIAEYFSIRDNQIYSINEGNGYYCLENEIYPIREIRKTTEKQVEEVIRLLKTTSLNRSEIAEKVGVPAATVNSINAGRHFKIDGIKYPIRSNKWGLSEEDLEDIRRMLLDKKSDREITSKFNIPAGVVQDINSGKSYRSSSYSYPIANRQKILSDEQVDEIISYIRFSNRSLADIAKQYNVSGTLIANINKGVKKYRKDNLEYPLRPIKSRK